MSRMSCPECSSESWPDFTACPRPTGNRMVSLPSELADTKFEDRIAVVKQFRHSFKPGLRPIHPLQLTHALVAGPHGHSIRRVPRERKEGSDHWLDSARGSAGMLGPPNECDYGHPLEHAPSPAIHGYRQRSWGTFRRCKFDKCRWKALWMV